MWVVIPSTHHTSATLLDFTLFRPRPPGHSASFLPIATRQVASESDSSPVEVPESPLDNLTKCYIVVIIWSITVRGFCVGFWRPVEVINESGDSGRRFPIGWVASVKSAQMNTNETPLNSETAFRQARQTALGMLRVLEDPNSTREEVLRACSTIRDVFNLAELQEPYAAVVIERQASGAARNEMAQRNEARLDSQEAAFWRRVLQLMRSKSITQMQLAERLGSTQPAVSQMLKRQCRPQRSTIMSLASAFDVPPQELWPDLEVTDILDTVAAFHQEQPMSESESEAIRGSLRREAAKAPANPLPKRQR